MILKNMDREKLKKYGFIAGVGLILVMILLLIVISSLPERKDDTVSSETTGEQEPLVRYVTKTETVYVDKVVPVEVEKEITTEILEEGLQDMGFLVTQEYLFKEVTTFESTKTYAWVLKADSKLVMGYEGTLLAGVDFGRIRVTKNDSSKKIRITLPKASVLSCELDLDSFELYQEDVSRWNPVSASDYNGSLKELKTRARERAEERGILEKAEENAEILIRSFVEGLVGADTYKIQFIYE